MGWGHDEIYRLSVREREFWFKWSKAKRLRRERQQHERDKAQQNRQ